MANSSQRTEQLLQDPIPRTLAFLAAPNLAVVAMTTLTNTLDVIWVGTLGFDALAGLSLAYPFFALMQSMSAGGMGTGVASILAQSMGARQSVRDMVPATVVVAIAMATLFAAVMLGADRMIYRAMGGAGKPLTEALLYSTVLFWAAGIFWLFNLLANVFRGIGNTFLPSAIIFCGGALHLIVSPALTFGWGPIPQFGIAGPALSITFYHALGLIVLAFAIARHPELRRQGSSWRVPWSRVRSILRIGAAASVNTLQTHATFIAITAFAGSISATVLAGYGLCARLEYLLVPLVFSVGQAIIPLVGTNVGARQYRRAKQAALVGALVAIGMTAPVGVLVATMPDLWLKLFTDDLAVLASGRTYLGLVGPAYFFVGLGTALYFACQAAGQVMWPLIASLSRLLTVVVGGTVVTSFWQAGPSALFAVVAISLALYTLVLMVGFKLAIPPIDLRDPLSPAST